MGDVVMFYGWCLCQQREQSKEKQKAKQEGEHEEK